MIINDYYDYIIHNLIKKFLFFLKNTILFIIKILNKFHYEIKKYIPYPYDYLLMTFLGYIFTDLLISKKSCISIKKTKPIVDKNFFIINKKIKEISNKIEKKLNSNNNVIINNNINNDFINDIYNNNIIFNENNKNQKDNMYNDLFNNLDNKINNFKNKISSLSKKNDEQKKNFDNIIKIQFEIYQKIFPQTQTPK